MIGSIINLLVVLAFLIVLFLLFRAIVWWYWGIDSIVNNLRAIEKHLAKINENLSTVEDKLQVTDNIQKQLQGINHKVYLFAKKFDLEEPKN